jgi:hypothetical protein
MDDILEFLGDNWYLALLALYWVFSLLFGKKKKDEQVKSQPQAKKAANQPVKGNQGAGAQAQAAQQKYRGRIEEALRNAMKEADPEFIGSRSPAASEQPSPTKIGAPVSMEAANADAFAFHSMMNRGEQATDYDHTAVDYDTTAIDYDTQKESAFAFHSATTKSADQEFHLTGFNKFHSAHGLSAEDRKRIEADDVAAEAGPIFSLGSRDDLRRAIIIQEVFGKPKAMRKF